MILFLAATIAVDMAVTSQFWPPSRWYFAVASLMFSQVSLAAVWAVVGTSSLAARLLLLIVSAGLWSWQWERGGGGVPAIDIACHLALTTALVTIPLVMYRKWAAPRNEGRQFSLIALICLTTGTGVLLGLLRQFTRPDDLRYVAEAVAIATTTALVTVAAAMVLLATHISVQRITFLSLVTAAATLVLCLAIIGDGRTACEFMLLHAALVVTSLCVWRIAGVRLRIDEGRAGHPLDLFADGVSQGSSV